METTGNWTDFNTQSFFLDAYDADTILLGLDDSYGDFSFMMLDAISFTRISSVPAPAAVWLFGSGLLGLVVFRRNRRI